MIWGNNAHYLYSMTTLIDATDLTWMRAMQVTAMPGTAVILRTTLTADGMGGFSGTPAPVGTVVGRLYSQNSRAMSEKVVGGQPVAETRWFFTAPYGTNITAADQLNIGGALFEVSEVNNSQDWKTAVRCSVRKMNEESAP